MESISKNRQAWMRLLALSKWEDFKKLATDFEQVTCEVIRKPETGLVMLRGRMGGTGSAFNIGEATVTRCAIKTRTGTEGHAYVMGRCAEHAKLAAICDALMQDKSISGKIERLVLLPLQEILNARRDLASRKAEATKVDFFTLVRGEND
jgi:alpha-D-ribose 1-methylphosphonate 5-triphosphate synthase subunit PhnG